MVRVTNDSYNNLNYNEILGDDITTEITVGTSPITLLSAVNINRRIVKIYSIQYSNPLALVWVRHGTNISVGNSSFPLPMKHLYENTSQAARPLSIVCTNGTALIRFTVVNKL